MEGYTYALVPLDVYALLCGSNVLYRCPQFFDSISTDEDVAEHRNTAVVGCGVFVNGCSAVGRTVESEFDT